MNRAPDGRVVDWDELLCGEIPLVGRDFELLVRPGGIEVLRGPMGTVRRTGDELLFELDLMVVCRQQDQDCYLVRPARETAPRVRLTDHRMIECVDASLVIVDCQTRELVYAIHPKGRNIVPLVLFGLNP